MMANGFLESLKGFKPYYKWITLNTGGEEVMKDVKRNCFKPYYKWITLNTELEGAIRAVEIQRVLNLIING